MKQNKSNTLLIIVFISMIMLPQITFFFVKGETSDVSTTENRMLNSKPTFQLKTIAEYPKKFDDYYSDHLPYRNMLRKCWANINYKLFHTTVDNRVLIGKEEWLFYRGNKSIEQVQGVVKYSDKQKGQILRALKVNVDKFKEKNIDTYVFVLPNKENIYREYLPDNIPIKNEQSQAEELIEYIRNNSDINIVYPKEALLEVKQRCQVYRKYDTHWNKVGACVGALVLQNNIDSSFEYDLNNLNIGTNQQEDIKDLANFASLEEQLGETVIRVNDFLPEIECQSNVTQKYEEYTSNSPNDKTVLMVGDSFMTDFKEYFSKLYKKVIYVKKGDYHKEIVEQFKPNIVIIETVERYSEVIANQLY